VGTTEENNHLEDLRVEKRIILKRILKEYYRRALKEFIWIKIEASGAVWWTR
jgi:hypothetical protein